MADELGLTQSAISQALKRLREVFGDPLFLGGRMGWSRRRRRSRWKRRWRRRWRRCGARWVSRGGSIRESAEGLVRIAALDAEQAVLVPALAAGLRGAAPGLQADGAAAGRGEAVAALAEGRADLALGFLWDAPEWVSGERLYEEGFLVAGLPEALPGAPEVGLDAYCAADHVLISPGGDLRGIVDRQLEELGRVRRVVLGLPAFLPALAAVAASGALVTLPARVARDFAPCFGLVTAEPPLAIRRFPVSVFWHRRNDGDPRTLWLRERIRASAAARGR